LLHISPLSATKRQKVSNVENGTSNGTHTEEDSAFFSEETLQKSEKIRIQTYGSALPEKETKDDSHINKESEKLWNRLLQKISSGNKVKLLLPDPRSQTYHKYISSISLFVIITNQRI
jgi:hypothetical protein